jgi:drug/metabolite transporter (DMT)-like permease
MQKNLLPGVALVLLSVLAWGGQAPVSKLALDHVDGYFLSLVRNLLSLPVFIALLAWREGWAAFSFERRFLLATAYGGLGFAGFGLLFFFGVSHSLPEHAVIILSLQPALTALWQWAVQRRRPPLFTLACIALCVFGLLLVVTKGDPAGALNSGTWFGDLLLFGAALCWMVYTAGVARFAHWSPLRYTTLSGLSAAVVLSVATALALAAGQTAMPALSEVGAVIPHMAFLVIVTAVVAGLAWNAGVRAIGALNALLLGNLVPVVTFSIRIAQGHHFLPIEFIGAGLVIVALAANNFYMRQRLSGA